MRRLLVVMLVLTACNRAEPTKQYQLTGQILDVKADTKEVLVRHEDIPGFMPAMTMPYKVEDAKVLAGKQAGDLITATLVVGETEAHLSKIDKTGHAPIENTAVPQSLTRRFSRRAQRCRTQNWWTSTTRPGRSRR